MLSPPLFPKGIAPHDAAAHSRHPRMAVVGSALGVRARAVARAALVAMASFEATISDSLLECRRAARRAWRIGPASQNPLADSSHHRTTCADHRRCSPAESG